GGFDTTKAKVIALHIRNRKGKTFGITFLCKLIDQRTAGTRQSKHLSGLVKSLSCSVIQRFSYHLHLEVISAQNNLCMSSRHGETEKRKFGFRIFNKMC